jgi:hypothetical protein
MSWILQPWPWYIAGPMIAGIMFFLLFFGKRFGFSSNLRTLCTIGGAGRFSDFFRYDWKAQSWNLLFALGSIIGGFIAYYLLSENHHVDLNPEIISELKAMGIQNPGSELLPSEIFNWKSLTTTKGFVMLVIGGFLVGFGARYAGGCTSGHAISGISNLQLPSVVAAICFFIGGIIATNFILPLIF